jgi:hypothetical protein
MQIYEAYTVNYQANSDLDNWKSLNFTKIMDMIDVCDEHMLNNIFDNEKGVKKE